jgi:hypothetical protein
VSVDVTVETIFERPVDTVAAYAADPGNAPEWYANINSIRWLSEPKVGTGARAAFVARFLGRTLEYTYELTRSHPASI